MHCCAHEEERGGSRFQDAARRSLGPYPLGHCGPGVSEKGALTAVGFVAADFACPVGSTPANSVELVSVPLQFEAMLLRELLLQGFDFVVLEFNDAAAVQADQMIVMLVLVGDFITRDPVTKMSFVGQAALLEQLERAVHRGVPDLWILFPHFAE